MASGFEVDVARLRAAGLYLQEAAGDLRVLSIGPVRAADETLLSTWRGPDRDRFRVAVEAVLEIGDTLVERLETAALLLLSAATTYGDDQKHQGAELGRLMDPVHG